MNINDALNILHVDNLTNIDLQSLKKKYHKLALQHHPDKNGNTIESKEHFQKIGEAYDLLKREIGDINIDEDDLTNNYATGYTFILTMFLKTLFKDVNYEIVLSILKDAVSVALFESIDKEMCIYIYDFIIKYKTVLHISDETLEKVKQIILEKYKGVQIFILNPSLFDLFDNVVFGFIFPILKNSILRDSCQQLVQNVILLHDIVMVTIIFVKTIIMSKIEVIVLAEKNLNKDLLFVG